MCTHWRVVSENCAGCAFTGLPGAGPTGADRRAPGRSPGGPSRRHGLTPVLEQILQGVVDPDPRRPAGVGLEPPRIAEHDRVVARAQARRIGGHGDGDPSQAYEGVEQIADAKRLATTDVVRLPGASTFDEQPVGANRVAYVRDVAPGIEVSDTH